MKNIPIFAHFLLIVILLPACRTNPTKIVSITYPGADTSVHVTFRATVITGNEVKSIVAQTPFTLNFTNESFIVTAIPEIDTLKLLMDVWDEETRTSKGMGHMYAGTLFYLYPNGGPGYMGSPK